MDKIKGFVEIFDPDSNELLAKENMIVSGGRKYLLNRVFGNTAKFLKYMKFGNGNGIVSTTDRRLACDTASDNDLDLKIENDFINTEISDDIKTNNPGINLEEYLHRRRNQSEKYSSRAIKLVDKTIQKNTLKYTEDEYGTITFNEEKENDGTPRISKNDEQIYLLFDVFVSSADLNSLQNTTTSYSELALYLNDWTMFSRISFEGFSMKTIGQYRIKYHIYF